MTHAVWRQQEYTYCNLLAAQHFPSYKRNCSKQRVATSIILSFNRVCVSYAHARVHGPSAFLYSHHT